MRLPGWLYLVCIQAVFTHATSVGIRLMAGYRALEYGADPAAIGLVAAAFAVPALFCALPLGRLSDRWGGATVLAGGIAFNLAGVAAAVLATNLATLIVGCALGGLGHIGVLVGQQTVVANRTMSANRDVYFGWLTTGSSIGQLVGPPAVGLAASAVSTSGTSTLAGLIVTAAFAFLAMPLVMPQLLSDRTLRRSASVRAAGSTRSALRIPGLWRSLVVSGVTLASIDLLYTFFPVWAAERGIDVAVVGWLLGLRALVTVASRFGIGRLLARFGRKTLLVVAILFACVGFATLPFADTIGAAIVMLALGVGLGIPQPLTVSWVILRAPGSAQGTVLGLRLTANRLAQSVIPVGVGFVAAPLGASGVFWANAVLLLGSAAVTLASDLDGGPNGDDPNAE